MEPLSVIALTGNILQFVERVGLLISAGRELSVSGARKENIELSTIAQELRGLVSRVILTEKEENTQLSNDEKSIRALGEQCDQVAQELLGVLKSLEVKSRNGRFGPVESFYKVLLSEWKKSKIDALQERLDRIGIHIQTHISSYDAGKILGRLEELSAHNRLLHGHRNDEIIRLKNQIADIFDGISMKLQKQESRSQTMAALLSAATSGSQYATEQFILEHLRFEEIDYRYENIRDAHNHTLSWLFDTDEQHSPATFDEWLGSEDDLYWVSGKPGSGKSTLMKYLNSSPRTVEKLKAWTQQKRLIHAAYFFWDAGKSIQKSLEGLLRTLLFDILRQNPDMIPQVYPNIWRLFSSNNDEIRAKTSTSTTATISLSVQGLLKTLRIASDVAAGLDARFFFLIDGLDEYEGQPNDIIEFISLLRSLPNVKICVSSRPWNEFEREFGKSGSRKLFMQDFNGADIKNYVYDTLDHDENYQELEDKETNGKLLVEEIVQASNGVFLWVFLIVRSFQEGLENGDRVSDLRERLKELPRDLNKYFDRIILSDVAEFYHGHSAEMFMVTLKEEEDVPLIAYWFLREDPKYVLDMETKPLSVPQFNRRLKDTTKRLNASCKGLLEVRHLMSQNVPDEQSSLPSSILFDRKVGFLHRTVRDYLKLEGTKAVLQSWCSSGFDPHETICKMILAQIKISPQDSLYSGPLSGLHATFLLHRGLVTATSSQTTITELSNEFNKLVNTHSTVGNEQVESSQDTVEACLPSSSKAKDGTGHISKLISKTRNKFYKPLQ